jgi:hypothetical protein
MSWSRELSHRYFSAADWGLTWEVEAGLLGNATHPPPPPLDHGFEVALGPWFLLGGYLFGIALNVNRRIGDVSCAWRLSYSPGPGAFGIWGVIYSWSLVSIVLQLAHGYLAPSYIGVPQANYLEALAWAAAGVWGVTFGRGANYSDIPGYIGLAAFVLVAAALLALGAVSVEQSWRSDNVWQMLGVGVPYALLAGWLVVAATVNIGIAIVSATRAPDERCARGRWDGEYGQRLRAQPIEPSRFSKWVPCLAAIGVSVAAFLLPDPVLVLPVAWGIWKMRRSLENWIALEVLGVTFVATVVQVATRRWVIKDLK